MPHYCVDIIGPDGINPIRAVKEWLRAVGLPNTMKWEGWGSDDAYVSFMTVWIPDDQPELMIEFKLRFGEVTREAVWLKDGE